jgi:hypothetical protein
MQLAATVAVAMGATEAPTMAPAAVVAAAAYIQVDSVT